ncbi:MAG: PEP-CTERM sorting domain-containing protein [Nostocales cyanobacterium]|nr:MAG: PEP-CTERM sorting domain-containing protein [Nostocales cyanobacterium]
MTTVNVLTKLSMATAGAAVIALGVAGNAQAANLVTNGNFDAGLTGWTISNPSSSPNGVAAIDIDGGGPLGTSAAFFTKAAGGFGTQPLNLSQTVSLVAGKTYSFFANIASVGGTRTNSSGGIVTASIAGTNIANFNFGSILANNLEVSTLSGTFTASTTGSQLLNLNFFRPFTFSSNSPTNYVDNVILEGEAVAAVPEPASLMGILGLGAFGVTSLRKRKQATAVKA